MDQEVEAASTFLSSFLPPTTTPTTFSDHLSTTLQQRYAHHWHPQDPERGSAYRALVRSTTSLDTSILSAAHQAGISNVDIERALASGDGKIWLGDRWTLWVDPGCVSLRVERGDGSVARDSQFIEIWGKLPESLRSHAVPLASFASASVNISTPTLDALGLPSASSTPPAVQDSNLLSPTKRSSKAIQILPPPARPAPSSSQAFNALRPSSPLGKAQAPPIALLASPLIIPPTPLRPSYGGLTPSPTGFPLFPRRSSSRGSSFSSQRSSSNHSDSSDGEGSASDGVFSSTESLSSSVTSAGTSGLWKAQQEAMDGEFKYPALPVRPTSANGSTPLSPYSFPHQRSHSSTSNHQLGVPMPMSPSKMMALAHGARSLPNSPTKPRRRGTRGGSGQGSQSYAAAHGHPIPVPRAEGHEAGSSISSMTSITSAASASSTSRTREQALAGTLTEHSGGKVGVLGGGVLLGLAGAKMLGNARGEVIGEAKRRGRERRRGGQGRKEGGAGGFHSVQPMPVNAGYAPFGGWQGEMGSAM
ncbi:hypothetical protein BCR35DRAFT_299578 [Leucosporidium creatinivorum]|uniref:Anti-proliferative protein domain-containing protein n=1 Tax=Leucosporidium creatinivorum TaxID=106004 RepID=A0A1Y2G211_9BASI|nr:hypothetical protein BCR35DRAFT_299578 [Leucosporidium creatinivorum]